MVAFRVHRQDTPRVIPVRSRSHVDFNYAYMEENSRRITPGLLQELHMIEDVQCVQVDIQRISSGKEVEMSPQLIFKLWFKMRDVRPCQDFLEVSITHLPFGALAYDIIATSINASHAYQSTGTPLRCARFLLLRAAMRVGPEHITLLRLTTAEHSEYRRTNLSCCSSYS